MSRLSKHRPTTDAPPMADPLAVIPRHAPGVDILQTASGEYHLRKKYPPGRGIMSFLRKRLGWKHECYYNLDAHGTEFWKLVDGYRTLDEISTIVTERWAVTSEEGRRASVLYVRNLMLRNLIVLQVPGTEKKS